MTDSNIGTTVSPKVVAGTAGAGAGAILTAVVVWVVGAAWSGRWDAAGVEVAVDAVPAPLAALLALIIAVALTLIPAWWIRDHVREVGAETITKREDDIPGEVLTAAAMANGLAVQEVPGDFTPDGAYDATEADTPPAVVSVADAK